MASRRLYLIGGSAGAGKTTIARALAQEYGQRLANEARHCGIPLVAARPRETLLKRVRATLGAAEA